MLAYSEQSDFYLVAPLSILPAMISSVEAEGPRCRSLGVMAYHGTVTERGIEPRLLPYQVYSRWPWLASSHDAGERLSVVC